LPPPETDTTWFRVFEAVSLASVAAGLSPVEGTMPPIPGPDADADPPGEVDVPALAGELEAVDDGATDLAVSTVLLLPTVDVVRGIFAALGAFAGAKTLAAFVVGVAGAATGGEEIAAPADTGLPIPATVGVPGTPVPRTGEVGSA
jgi:hypothetical protein